MSSYAKPENALRKAQDLEKVGKEVDALQTLSFIICSRKYRVWTPVHEQVMEKYIDLAVLLRWKYVKKEFLQYRMICQQANPSPNLASLAKIVRLYQEKSEAAAEEVFRNAQSISQETPDDLEETPESIMLQAVSGEDSKERKDKQLVTPIIKFLWETYRVNLEVLRNIGKLQDLYHETATCAFAFCLKFKRSMEFRRLGQILRDHINTINKYAHQSSAVDLNSPETQKLYLRTRFEQLRVSSELEIWQEAYKTIEDIHNSMVLSNTPPAPSLMRTYYEKLTQIFWASDNYLFHAYSMSKFHQLTLDCEKHVEETKTSKKEREAALLASSTPSLFSVSNPESAAEFATCVLMATLIVNPISSEGDTLSGIGAEMNENMLKLAALLGFKKEIPTRARLLQELVSRGILNSCSEEGKVVYMVVEKQFSPLTMHKQLAPIFTKFEASPVLSKFVPALKNLVVFRLLQQLSTVFKCMKIERFCAIAPALAWSDIEKMIMSAVRNEQLFIRVDHRKQLLLFQTENNVTNDRLKNQLSTLCHAFQRITDKIVYVPASEKEQERKNVFEIIASNIGQEHENIAKRQQEIETRKMVTEKEQQDREKVRNEIQAAEKAKRAEEEKRRLDEDAHIREQARLNKERMEKEQERAKELESRKEEMKAKTEGEKKKSDEARKFDYFVRASRMEEHDLWKQQQEKKMKEEKGQWEADFAVFQENHKKQHEKELEQKHRLLRTLKEKAVFIERVMAVRNEQYQIELKEQKARLDEQRRMREAAARRKAEEEEQRRREEEERVEKEIELERQRQEAEERKHAERAARDAEREMEMQKARERFERDEALRKEDEMRKSGNMPRDVRLERDQDGGDGPRKYKPGMFKAASRPNDREDRERPSRPAGNYNPPGDNRYPSSRNSEMGGRAGEKDGASDGKWQPRFKKDGANGAAPAPAPERDADGFTTVQNKPSSSGKYVPRRP